MLEVEYDKYPKRLTVSASFWDNEKMLPHGKYRHYEVGGTKLIKSHSSSNLFLKLETGNPTRSFKDRGSVIEVAKAAEYGYGEIACASTGNMAYSISYYSKLFGIKARVFISSDANVHKIDDILSTHDAIITKVNGDFNKAQGMAERYCAAHKSFLGGDYCYRKEGQRTLAYEIVAQVPDVTHIIVPVGNATLISGIYKAAEEMKRLGALAEMPRLIGVQAAMCSPVVKALKYGNGIKYERPATIADAIAVGMPAFGYQAIESINRTGGAAVSVTESEMLVEQKNFYREYGFMAETAGVAAIAAFKKIKLGGNYKAVAIISGGNV